ncbi:phage integrase SAM-like domain-containing protein [Flavobacterium sp. PLA-1-15]
MTTTCTIKARAYVNKAGQSPLYLDVAGNYERERIPLEIDINAKLFDQKKQRLDKKHPNAQDLNLLLEKITSKCSDIKIHFRLNDILLTPKLFREAWTGGLSRVNFVAYFEKKLEDDRHNYGSKGTYRRYQAVGFKLKKFNPHIPFNTIDDKFFESFRNWLAVKKRNKKTTQNSNIIVLKKFLRLAQKDGIKLMLDLDDVKGGSMVGNRAYLNPEELLKLFKFYEGSKINYSERLTLGYFLFSCMTAMRLSDVMKTDRCDLSFNEIAFVNTKTTKDQNLKLNLKAQEIVTGNEDLFVEKYTPEAMNRLLKVIAKKCKIKKTISFHVARHTFATCFLRKEIGGDVQSLQKLLKHSKITTTMIYVHILETEANEQVFFMDKLFK